MLHNKQFNTIQPWHEEDVNRIAASLGSSMPFENKGGYIYFNSVSQFCFT